MTTDEDLHAYARKVAETLQDPDKKQLRFNDIVSVAREFYPTKPMAGVRELVHACDRAKAEMYEKGNPMWKSLRENYRWMLVD